MNAIKIKPEVSNDAYMRVFKFTRKSVTYPFNRKSPVGIKRGSPYIFRENSLLKVGYDSVTNDILEIHPEFRITIEEFEKYLKDGSLVELKVVDNPSAIKTMVEPNNYEPPETLYGNFTNRNIKLFLGALIIGFLIYKYNKK